MSRFTTKELIDFLLKLGIDPNTADCYMLWMERYDSEPVHEIYILKEGETFDDLKNSYSCTILPCWSRYAIQRLLPSQIEINEEVCNLCINNLDIKYITLDGSVLVGVKDDGGVEPIITMLTHVLTHEYRLPE